MKEKDEAASSTGDQHLLHLRSSSPSLTPAASSVGASSPAVPTNGGGADFGQVQDSKGGSLARIGSEPISASLSTTSAGSCALGTSKPSCRPWERGDLLRRLSTFSPTNWFGKSKAASSLACARRGWVNVDVDKIECESCGATTKFVLSAGLGNSEADAAEEEFAEKLDHEHKDNCPWIGNHCAESLVQFPPASPSALIAGYRDRCEVLLQFPSLPIVAASSIEHMKISRGPEIDRLLQSQIIGSESGNKLETLLTADKSRDDDVFFLYSRAQKLMSVCGWEPRWLPNVQDCEEHSAQSAKNGFSVGALKHRGPPRDPSRGKKSLSSSTKKDYYNAQVTKSRTMSQSPLLDCSLCGAMVRIWNFLTVSRPSSFVPINSDIPEASKKMAEEYDEGATGEGKSLPNLGVDLNLTLSAGLSSSQMHVNVITDQYDDAHHRGLGRNLPVGQPSSSEVGDRAASYESHGPSSRKRNLDEGGSTVDRPQLVLQQVDSDDSGHYSAGPSKRARDSYRVEFDQGPEQVRDSTRVSSVVAVDTVHSANSDSMESVENYPADLGDINMPSTSEIKITELHEASDLNYSTPAQQGNCPSTARSTGVSSANEEELVNADNATAQGRDGPSFGISGGIVGMGDSHKSEIHGADASMNRADSVTGEVEHVAELNDNLGQTGEFAPDPVLMGDFVPEEIDREHGQGDSQDLASHSAARADSGSKIVDSKKEESVESGEKTSNIQVTSRENSPHPSLSCNAVVYSGFEPSKGEVSQSPKYLTNDDFGYVESGFQGASGTGPPNGGSNYDEVVEFDPIKHHLVTCPWVNGNVAAAGCNNSSVSSLGTALCGWQLTLDALDAYQTLGQVPVQTVESESAASLYKVDRSNRPEEKLLQSHHSFDKSHSNN